MLIEELEAMRTAVVVTFDLHDVHLSDTSAYTRIKADLSEIRLNRFVVRRDAAEVSLPYNTYVGIYKGPFYQRDLIQIRSRVREKALKIIERHHHRATVFVLVARKWAWTRPLLR